jgi:hypothetical protein
MPTLLPGYAPIDFFLFEEVKRRLTRSSLENPNGLLSAIKTIQGSIEKSIMKAVYRDKLRRS